MSNDPVVSQIRSSQRYFFECLFIKNENGDGIYKNPVTINLSTINADTKTHGTPQLYTVSLSDYIIEHNEDSSTGPVFNESDRCMLVLDSKELTKGKTRYMTIIGNDSGIGLFGSNALVLTSLPDSINLKLGFINLLDATDQNIYNPNKDYEASSGGIVIKQLSQKIVYCLFRLAITVSYL